MSEARDRKVLELQTTLCASVDDHLRTNVERFTRARMAQGMNPDDIAACIAEQYANCDAFKRHWCDYIAAHLNEPATH